MAASVVLGVPVERREALRGGNRANVQRLALPDSTAVIKEFHQLREEWAREAAALQILPRTVLAPRLLAASAHPPILVMTDLGSGRSVADALLGNDPELARSAVLGWAAALAHLHSDTSELAHHFALVLAERDALVERNAAVPSTRIPAMLNDAARALEAIANELGVRVPAGALDRLRALLSGSGAHALSPADACPDNNITTSDGLALLDFEGAEYRHVAWDAAYLAVPWPSCWCSWRLPEELTRAALDRYREVANVPYLRTAQFDEDLERASVGWAMVSTHWFAANALGDDPAPSDPRIVAPPRRAMILHRLAGAAEAGEVEPELADFAAELRRMFVRRWGPVALEYAPAFRRSGELIP